MPNLNISRRRMTQLGAGLLAASALTCFAQSSYPSKPVRIVVGFSAGGTTDVVARIMAKELTERLGQTFMIENRPGGGSNIATEAVKAAQPDGYTLLFVAVTSAINQSLYPNIKFDLNRDFEAVALGAKVGINNHLKIGDGAQVTAMSGVKDDIPPNGRWGGFFAKPTKQWFKEIIAVERLVQGGTAAPKGEGRE